MPLDHDAYVDTVIETCWLVTPRGRVLHHGRFDTPLDPDAPAVAAWGTTSCGHRSRLAVPGIFTRLRARRCQRCCELTGLPPGTGSPRNDLRCRQLLGLNPTRGDVPPADPGT